MTVMVTTVVATVIIVVAIVITMVPVTNEGHLIKAHLFDHLMQNTLCKLLNYYYYYYYYYY